MTLACEDANSKLVDDGAVVAEKLVDESLVEIRKLKFGQDIEAVGWSCFYFRFVFRL